MRLKRLIVEGAALMAVAVCLSSCISLPVFHAPSLLSKKETPPQSLNSQPVTMDNGSTQVSNIENHGTLNIYLNSEQKEATPPAARSSNITASAESQIKQHEGLSLKPYEDQTGTLHIGYGRNLEANGVTAQEAEMMFQRDVAEAREDLQNLLPHWSRLPLKVRDALLDMRFQLGPNKLRKFKEMLKAVKQGNWRKAAEEMEDSAWASQTPARAQTLIEQVRSIGEK